MRQTPRLWAASWCMLAMGVLAGCGTSAPVQPNLPPSESDLTLLSALQLCDRQTDLSRKLPQARLVTHSWGTGHEVLVPGSASASHGDESYFFDENGLLVGALFSFPRGLDLEPYPVLRRTLSQLRPSQEFYLAVPQLATKAEMGGSSIYETGDEKTTQAYLVTGGRARPLLLMASVTIDPYARLFALSRQEFLNRLRGEAGRAGERKADGQPGDDKEPFVSLQQFARGQAAQLAYCQEKNYEIAADAYQKAIASGFSNKVWLAEAHHRLGVAWDAKGQMEKAKAELLTSLSIRPNVPEVLNNLGTVHRKLGEKTAALSLFEKAVVLRPNYAMARYNLANAYEATNPKRAIAEYETFIALVEGIPDEEGRMLHAKERIEKLKKL